MHYLSIFLGIGDDKTRAEATIERTYSPKIQEVKQEINKILEGYNVTSLLSDIVSKKVVRVKREEVQTILDSPIFDTALLNDTELEGKHTYEDESDWLKLGCIGRWTDKMRAMDKHLVRLRKANQILKNLTDAEHFILRLYKQQGFQRPAREVDEYANPPS